MRIFYLSLCRFIRSPAAFATLAVTGVVTWTSVPIAEEAASWVIKRGQAECLIANAESLASKGGNKVLIYIFDCPRNDPGKALEKMQKNSILPTPANNKVDAVLVFSSEELRCLRLLHLDLSADLVRIPRAPKC